MTPAQFVNTFLPEAQICAQGTGLNPCLFLAQWADETGWGVSSAFSNCRNLAGINPFNGYPDCQGYARFSSYTQSAQAEVEVLHNGLYDGVLASAGQSFNSQASALGNSPWATGKYNDGGGPGSSLISIFNNDISPYTSCPTGYQPPPNPNPPPVLPPINYPKPSSGGNSALLAGVLLIGAGTSMGAIVLVTQPQAAKQLRREFKLLRRRGERELNRFGKDIAGAIPK